MSLNGPLLHVESQEPRCAASIASIAWPIHNLAAAMPARAACAPPPPPRRPALLRAAALLLLASALPPSRAAEFDSTYTLECQVAGLNYQSADECTCAFKLPVCPDLTDGSGGTCQDLIDAYYAACCDQETVDAGELEEWNIAHAPVLKAAAEKCGCDGAWAAAAPLWALAALAAAQLLQH